MIGKNIKNNNITSNNNISSEEKKDLFSFVFKFLYNKKNVVLDIKLKKKIINKIIDSIVYFFNHPLEKQEINSKLEVFIPFIKKIFLSKEILNSMPDNLNDYLNFLEDEFLSNIKTSDDYFYSILSQRCKLIKHYISFISRFDNLYLEAKKLYNSSIDLDKQITFFLIEIVKKNIFNKYYYNCFLNLSLEELFKIFQIINFNNDFLYDAASFSRITRFYLFGISKNKTLLLTLETIQIMYLLIAINLTLDILDFNKRLIKIKHIYNALSLKKISLPSPNLISIRLYGKNNYSSCFITQMGDSISQIYNTLSEIADISKQGGGVGCHIGKIRAVGSWVKHLKGVAGGTVQINKLLNTTAIMVNQNGKRKGAITVALDCWHLDIFSFLEIQEELGEQKDRCYDIFPQIVIEDYFLRLLDSNPNSDFYILDPYDIIKYFGFDLTDKTGVEFDDAYKTIIKAIEEKKFEDLRYKKYKIKKLFIKIFKNYLSQGLPYCMFKTTVNKNNPNKHKGIIYSGNLCMESFTNFNSSNYTNIENRVINKDGLMHICNLASINLANIYNLNDLEFNIGLITEIINRVIIINTPPTYSAIQHDKKYKSIGIGFLGLHDYLSIRNIKYEDSIDEVNKIFSVSQLFALIKSNQLAQEYGTYEYFLNSSWFDNSQIDNMEKYIKTNLNEFRYINLINDLKINLNKFGLYNGYLFAIAPNTSTSLIQNASASVLPVYSNFYFDSNTNGLLPIFARFCLNRKDIYELNTFYNIDNKRYIDVISNIQKFIDQGISTELLFNLSEKNKLTAKYIKDIFLYAWKKKLKTLYYIRIREDSSIKTSLDKLNKKKKLQTCYSCSG